MPSFFSPAIRRWCFCTIAILGFVGTHTGASASPLQPVALQLKWHPQFQFAGYYMALEKKFFEDAGFNVEIRPIRPGICPVTEVVEERADFGIADASLLLDHHEGKPVVAVMAVLQHSPAILLGKQDHGMKSIHDVPGKRVMLMSGYQNLSIQALLHRFGLENSVTRMDSSTDIDDLLEDRVDLFNAYSSNEPFELESRGFRPLIIDPKSYGIDFYGDILFTSRAMVSRSPEKVAAFRSAVQKGWQYALSHPEETIDILKTRYAARKTKSHLRFEANVIREAMQPDIVEIGHMNPARWEKIRTTLVALGLLPPQSRMDGLFFSPPPRQVSLWIYWPWAAGAATGMVLVSSAALYLMRLNRKLKRSLNEIKTLKGLLPICSFCKRIRSEKGEWERIESYICTHSGAKCSHSVCPECMRIHYPEFSVENADEPS